MAEERINTIKQYQKIYVMNECITQFRFTIPRMEYHHSFCDVPVWHHDTALHRATVYISWP